MCVFYCIDLHCVCLTDALKGLSCLTSNQGEFSEKKRERAGGEKLISGLKKLVFHDFVCLRAK